MVRLKRIAAFDTPSITLTLDGRRVEARQGESVLTVMLRHAGHVRRHEADGEKRAGFCLMGACQDCWVWLGPDWRGRACTTLAEAGMHISTTPTGPGLG